MDVEKLISEIFIRTALWDQKNKDHHNTYIIDKLWDEVAEELETTQETARNKWKALRDKFSVIAIVSASLPKSKSRDAGIKYQSSWKYFESLQFLTDQFTPRESSGNLCKKDETVSTGKKPPIKYVEGNYYPNMTSPLSSETTHLVSNSSNISQPSISATIIPTKMKPIKRRAKDDIGMELLNIEKSKLEYLQKKKMNNLEEDDDFNFFKSIIPHIKHMSAIDKMSYRINILRETEKILLKLNCNQRLPTNPSNIEVTFEEVCKRTNE